MVPGKEIRIMDEPEALAQDLGAEELENPSGVVGGQCRNPMDLILNVTSDSHCMRR